MKNVLLFVVLFSSVISAQNNLEDIEDSFEDFSELSREQIFTHVNKSTFVTGENIWFKTYAISRDDMSLSSRTANFYCVLSDAEDKPIKQKMIMGFNGVSNGQFMIDSTFKSGEYKLKVFTNHSKNFKDEYVHYQTNLKIINPNDKKFDKPQTNNDNIDVQLLPESGHLLANTINKVGIVAKDQLGKPVGNLRVTLFEDDKQLSEVNLNSLGINVFNFLPKLNAKYKVTYNYRNSEYEVEMPNIDSKGLIINLTNEKDNFDIQLKSNEATWPEILNKPYKITVHNSVDLLSYDVIFQSEKTLQFNLSKSNLFPGINIITLFNPEGKPIAERICFNFLTLDVKEVNNKANVSKINDSLIIKIPVDDVFEAELQSLSASILPKTTKSYHHNNSIISAFHLRPYLKSAVANLDDYFYDTTAEKEAALDQLLLTQGWSSYDWSTIFNNKPEPVYDFEYGINYKLSSNADKEETFLIYPNSNTKSEILTIKTRGESNKLGFFPSGDKKLRIGKVLKNKDVGTSELVVNFSPNKIPEFRSYVTNISAQTSKQFTNQNSNDTFGSLDDQQILDDVLIIKNKEYTRIEKLQNKSLGKIYDFDEKMKRRYRTFGQFISGYGYKVVETKGFRDDGSLSLFTIETRRPTSINASKIPLIFLDGVFLIDFDILSGFSMNTVDYVEVNKGGTGEGIRAGAGVIRIYTDPNKSTPQKYKSVYTAYDVPLSFDQPKTYYSPKFGSTQSNFFKEYGTINWKPNLKVVNGFVEFKIPNLKQEYSTFLEGIVNGNVLISEIINIKN